MRRVSSAHRCGSRCSGAPTGPALEAFLAGCRRLGWRYVKLGLGLLVAYAFTAAAYFGLLFGGYALADNVGVLLWWTVIAAAASSAVIVWITVVNFLYLITQIVMAVDDVGLRAALATVVRFLRSSVREIAGIFGVVLLLVLLATAASVLATAARASSALSRSSPWPSCLCRSRPGSCAASCSSIWR